MAQKGNGKGGGATRQPRQPGNTRGPLPGHRNSGSFKRGDPRINRTGRPVKTAELRSLELLCKGSAEEAVTVLREIMLDKDAPVRERRACAAELLDRGYGKAVDRSVIASLSGSVSDAAGLTSAQLAQIAAGGLTPALEGEAQAVEIATDSDGEG